MAARMTGAVTALADPVSAEPASPFADRHDAGRRLAPLLERFRLERPIVLGMARGGVPVAWEVARALGVPLDVVLVRKVGAPQNREYAIGAVAEGGVHVIDAGVARSVGLAERDVQALIARAERELAEQAARYRGDRGPLDLYGRTAILVDDGLATGRSARAAIRSLRARGAARVILAVPVAAASSAGSLREEADVVISAELPEDLWAVGLWYEDFSPTSDGEVAELLRDERARWEAESAALVRSEIEIAVDAGMSLEGELSVPAGAAGLVLFAHGSGSSRLSPRNRRVASRIVEAGFATLLFDLLTEQEAQDRANVFDVRLLASRLLAAGAWAQQRQELAGLPLAYFGASTGAAAALTAAAAVPERVRAIISRGGRPDLAENLERVRAPTLLIVGGADTQVLQLNQIAQGRMSCPCKLAVVAGATHLFEEPGAIGQVAELAVEWLQRRLPQSPGEA
jgi:predicted phosphoribosyltransferase/dienelactone hydrolase